VIDGALMKVMKSRRLLEYNQLIIETTKLLSLRFKPNPMQIKLRMENLIERGFLERDEDDKRMFKYIA
jgi:cullin 3